MIMELEYRVLSHAIFFQDQSNTSNLALNMAQNCPFMIKYMIYLEITGTQGNVFRLNNDAMNLIVS